LDSIAMQTPMPPEAAKEIEHVKSLVARRFPVYDVKISYDVIEFYCRIDEASLEESFEKLREDMSSEGYVPMISYDKGEHVIVVGKKPPRKYRSIYVNLTMLIITFAAMVFAGVLDWTSYASVPDDEMYSLENIATGIAVFTLPLLAILGVHELAHFFAAKRRKVAASLPFFIPSIPPLGTFGAFISLRDPIPNRKSLLEIGIAGPLAGLLVAIPIGIAGLMLTNMEARPVPDDFETGSIVRVAFPIMYDWIEQLAPLEGDYLLHPMAFAAWVGFLVTALNLLPAGQLDGGHIARAVFGKNAKYASWATIVALIALSFFYFAWLLFAILILFLGGAKHPPPLNDITKLDPRRQALGMFAFVILVIAFVPIPISVLSADHSFDMSPAGTTEATLGPGEYAVFTFTIENLGNVRQNISVYAADVPSGWAVGFKLAHQDDPYEETVEYRFGIDENVTYEMRATCGPSPPGNRSLRAIAAYESPEGDERVTGNITYSFTVTYPTIEFWAVDSAVTAAPGSEVTASIMVNNTADTEVAILLEAFEVPSMIGVTLYEEELDENSSMTLELTVPANDSATVNVLIFIASSATTGDRVIQVQGTYFEVELDILEITVSVT
jgi:membrane-associated protease RseP (regulator of RpoE activity)